MTIARSAAALIATAALAFTLVACASEPRGGADRLPGPLPEGASYSPATESPAAPSLDGTLVDGTSVDLDTLAAGRPLIVQFMTSWCSNCADQQEVISKIASEFGDSIAIVHVSGDRDTEALNDFLDGKQVQNPVIIDPEMQIWRSFAVTEPPMTALIDSEGHLVKLWPAGADAEKIREELDRIIVSVG
ncbi:TlpA family protein disulfide reductase [Agromyces sp. NPDC055520]